MKLFFVSFLLLAIVTSCVSIEDKPSCGKNTAFNIDVINDLNIPKTAIELTVFQYGALDLISYIHFKDNKSNIDRFSEGILGFIPYENKGRFLGVGDFPELSCWLDEYPAKYRIGRLRHEIGILDIIIVDHDKSSEIWLVKSNDTNLGN